MTAQTDTLDAGGKPALAPQALRDRLQPFWWSLRRELWEHRAVAIAPLVGAAAVLCGLLLAWLQLLHFGGGPATPRHVREHLPEAAPYFIAAIVVSGAGSLVAWFYCLGALYNERRDRSILFWKSLPVSNLTSVLSKFAVPTLAIPATVFVIATATMLIIAAFREAAILSQGADAAAYWAQVPLIEMIGCLLYVLVVNAFWMAPVWAYLLVISAYAKRMPILWAFAPWVVLAIIEQIAFDTGHVNALFTDRMFGGMGLAMNLDGLKGQFHIPELTPLRLLASPGLWGGLVAAAAMLLLASWLRRRAEPV